MFVDGVPGIIVRAAPRAPSQGREPILDFGGQTKGNHREFRAKPNLARAARDVHAAGGGLEQLDDDRPVTLSAIR